MADTRKKYTKEFKLDAIRLLEPGTKPGHQIERDLGIGSGQIYRWRRQLSEDGGRAFPGNGKSRDEELAALRKEVKELREERDILRKATAIFSRPPR
jgi:transposase